MVLSPRSNPSYWQPRVAAPRHDPLKSDLQVEVAVVGGGITGLTAALHLQREGLRVAVLELQQIAAGTTGHSTGHLDVHPDQTVRRAVRQFGADPVRAVLDARRRAVERVEQWVRQYEIDCDFARIDAWLYAHNDDGRRGLEREIEAMKEVGLVGQLKARSPLPFPHQGAIVIPDQARFDPRAYTQALAQAFVQRNGRIFEQTCVQDIQELAAGACRVTTPDGKVTADHVISATHAPLLGLWSLQSRAYPRQSYVLGVRVRRPIVDALFWDTDDPYHYTRRATSSDPELLIIGGADHHTGEAGRNEQQSFDALERYAAEHFEVQAIEHRWSHEYFEPADGLPYIGRVPGMNRVWVATGFSGDGLSYGTMAGMLLGDEILGRSSPAAKVLDPSRIKPLASAPRLAQGAATIARHFVGDRLSRGEVASPLDVQPGQGRCVAWPARCGPCIATRTARCTTSRPSAATPAAW
jgi:glycine/D-amino acid oxidase-like deaminating enzyme